MEGKSELAQLLGQIDEQRRASQAGLTGYAVVGDHESIIARMQQLAEPVLQLFRQGRSEDAARLWESQ